MNIVQTNTAVAVVMMNTLNLFNLEIKKSKEPAFLIYTKNGIKESDIQVKNKQTKHINNPEDIATSSKSSLVVTPRKK